MASFIDEVEKSYLNSLKDNLCKTCEGAAFMEKYFSSRSAISELENKVLSELKDSKLTVTEMIGFLEYMKQSIKNHSFLPREKEHRYSILCQK